MSVIAFDTHAFVKRLTGAGMPEAQAEVLADEQRRLIDDRLATKDDIEGLARATKDDIEGLARATKSDIERLERTTKSEIEKMKIEIKSGLAETKADFLKWMFGTIGFQTVVILGAVLALSRFAH